MNNYPVKVYLNGEILNPQDAKISIFDRGFLFGDGIYEVMVQLNGSFFYGKEHLERLRDCLIKIYIDFDVSVLVDNIERLLKASDLSLKDALVYLQVTRGVAPRKHHFPKQVKPTLMMYALPLNLPDINECHVSVVSMQDRRWHRCDIKTTSLLGNVMANDFAVKKDAYESIFVRDGKITEASHCNIFFVKEGVVYTHPANELILDGITRQLIIKLCKDLNIAIREVGVEKEKVQDMEEAFLTGTTTQVASIRQFDDHFFYRDDKAGPITKKLQEAFLKLKTDYKKQELL